MLNLLRSRRGTPCTKDASIAEILGKSAKQYDQFDPIY